jgi:hypothetical protein
VWAGITFCVWPPVLPLYWWTSLFILHISWPHSDTPYVISLSQLTSVLMTSLWGMVHWSTLFEPAVTVSSHLLPPRHIFCLHFVLVFLSYLRFVCQVLVPSYICALIIRHSPCDSMNLKYLKTSNLTVVFSLVDNLLWECDLMAGQAEHFAVLVTTVLVLIRMIFCCFTHTALLF